MKVYALPAKLPTPKVDYVHYDRKKVIADENAHKESLKRWLIERGYTGKHTGRIFSEPVADGYALYMVGDKGGARGSVLIHLPYGDGYTSLNVSFVPYREIIRRCDAKDRLVELFKKGKENDQASEQA